MSVISINDDTFKEIVLNSPLPVLVDFWAEWCGPCRALSPVLEEFASELDGEMTVVKVNVDESPKIATEYSVRGIPTLLLFKDGELQATKVGGLTKTQLKTFVENHL